MWSLPSEGIENARPYAEKALKLAPDLPDAEVSMALIDGWGDWKWKKAKERIRRALEIDPGYVWGRLMYGQMLAYSGRMDEAIRQFEKARELDPLTFDPTWADLGRLYATKGQSERAVAYWKKTLERAPGYFQTYIHFGAHLCEHEARGRGTRYLKRGIELAPEDPLWRAELGHCHAITGHEDEAQRILAALEEESATNYVTPVAFALLHVGLDEPDEALDALERAVDFQSMRLPAITWDPRFRSLRDDPRFQEIVRRMNLPVPPAS